MTCDPGQLLSEARCFQCLDEQQTEMVRLALLCIISQNGGGGGGSVAVLDDGVVVVPVATGLNFTNAGVTVSDLGGGVAGIDIPGGGGGSGGDIVANLVNAEVAIVGATSLTASAYGKMHVCTGSSYTVNLPSPAGNAGRFIGIRMGSSLTGLVTLNGGASTINDLTTRVMWSGESAVLLSDGSNWFKVAGISKPMMCVMRRTAPLSVPTTTWTNTLLDLTVTDNTGMMADLGTHQLNIIRPGRYNIGASLQFDGSGADTSNNSTCGIWKNGVGTGTLVSSSGFAALAGSFPTPLAATPETFIAGDYLQVGAYQGTSGNQNLLVAFHPCPIAVLESVSW